MSLNVKVIIICSLSALLFVFQGHGKESLKPYLFPEDHPLVAKLDQIFETNARVTLNAERLTIAGFKILVDGKRSKGKENVYVVSHPKLNGYLIKLYTDEQREKKKVKKYQIRLQKAKNARKIINQHCFQSLLKVPKKWIYQFPRKSASHQFEKADAQQTVLVVEDMKIVNNCKNSQLWKSESVTPDLLDAVYTVVMEIHLADHGAHNIPFSKDGRLSLIDLEHHAFRYKSKALGRSLAPKMKLYWKSLFRRNNASKEKQKSKKPL